MRTFLLLSALVLLASPEPIGAQPPANADTVLEGQVLNAVTGAPVSDARVKLAKSPNDEGSFTRTDERGRFHFSPPPADGYGYTLSAQSPGFLRPESINVSANPVIKLTPSAVITGKVTDPYGLPVSSCVVEVLSKQVIRPGDTLPPFAHRLPGGQVAVVSRLQLSTDDRGEFRAAPLDAGLYYVVTGRPSWGPWDNTFQSTYYPRAADLASAKPIELAAGQQVRADIRILRQTGVRVSGRIVNPANQDDSSAPALRTHIVLIAEDSSQLNPTRPSAIATDNFEIGEVLPGKYVLMASAYEPSAGGNKETSGAILRLTVADRDLVGVDVVLQPFRDLSGAVVFPAGCAPVPLRVSAEGQPPLGFGGFDALTEADGKFRLKPARSGKYVLYLSTTQGGPLRVSSARLGDRDVLKDGLEVPYSGNDPLRVSVDCPGKEALR